MGIDFIGYSRVKTEPVPERLRAKINPISKIAIKDLNLDTMNLVGGDAEGMIFVSPENEYEISQELQQEFYETIGAEEDFITVDWCTNIIYRKTAGSKICRTGRSYSGYFDFCNEIDQQNQLVYMPQLDGILSTHSCIECLQGLETVKKHFVSDEFVADPEKYGNSWDHRFNNNLVPAKENIHNDSWFFREFYSMMSVAADGGIVKIF